MGGYELGVQQVEAAQAQRRAHQQALSDAELESNIGQAQSNIANLQSKLSTIAPGSKEHAETMQSLQDAIQSRNDLFHPARNPGALAKFGHMIGIGPKPSQAAPPVAAPTITNTPAIQAGDVTLPESSYRTVEGPQTPGQLKAQAEAQQISAAAPPDPLVAQQRNEQEALRQKDDLANWSIDWAKRHGVTGAALQELTAHLAGAPASSRGTMKAYTLPGGEVRWLYPDEVPADAQAYLPNHSAPKVGSFGDFPSLWSSSYGEGLHRRP